ncbi:transposase [Streptosporangium canum]|uniref:transposase n=1 Tax=Streptosporangium canum TaxID=324952 RepID=UPI003F4C8F8C
MTPIEPPAPTRPIRTGGCDTTCVRVESTISEAVRAHGLRRCRYIGLAETRMQHVLIACAMNAARNADWTERDNPRSRTPIQQLQNPLQDPCGKLTSRVLAGALEAECSGTKTYAKPVRSGW